MPVWDNQQETSWFIGILEAEGCCGNTHRSSEQQIRIANTDSKILGSCMSFLNKRGVTYGLHTREDKKPLTTISVCGKNNCYTLLKLLDPDFQCRKQEFYDKLQLGSSTTTCDGILTSDLQWLIGVFEGEGCFTLDENRNTYQPKIRFVNTNKLIIEKFTKTLHENSLSWYIYSRESERYKTAVEVSITGMLRCKRFLAKTVGLWRSDIYNQRAKKLEKFLDLRLTVKKGDPYTQEQIQIYLDLKNS